MLAQNVYKFIEENRIIEHGSRIGCAVSGGADSVCLLHILKEISRMMELELYCLHFEHGIRAESIADMEFTRELAHKLHIPFLHSSADVPKIAVERGENLENTARELRYNFFFHVMKTHKLDGVCLAHHSEDVAESVILNLIRGSGISGLTGIAPRRPDGIMRPMLFATKQDVLRYVHDLGARYVTDETNFDTTYSRNHLRINIIPELKRINKNAVANIYRTAQNLRSESDVVEAAEESAFKRCVSEEDGQVSLDIKTLCTLHRSLAMRVIRRAVLCVSPKDIERVHLLAIYDLAQRGVTGKLFETATYRAVVRYSRLVLYKPGEKHYFVEQIHIPGITEFPGGALEVTFDTPLETFPVNTSLYQYVNPEMLKGAHMRSPEPGDEIIPFGRTSPRKLSRFLMEKKVPADVRHLPILAKEHTVLWVPGVGLSEKMRTHDKSARIEVFFNE